MSVERRLRHICLRVALAAVILLITGGLLQAQTTSATVSGTVKDAQGGVLPGATVTLTSETQGTITTVTTDTLGNFLFPYVRPDRYTLKVTLDNFQAAQRTGLEVNANDRIGVGAFTLNVGPVSETVTVTAESQDIQVKSGERGYTLQSTAMQNIAVNGRSFFGLIGLVPGVVPGATQGGGVTDAQNSVTQVSNFSANGARSNSNNMTIDGVANIDTGDNGGNMAQTNLDAVAEFRVLTSSYQAEYGRAIGAQVQVVTKSGTRSFSGSGYWYGRRSRWNANTWLNNRSNTPMPASSRNDQGFTVGGPIYIPGLFNSEKNKLFFFFSQEFERRNDPVSEVRVTVPTALERAGDFSQSRDASGNLYPYIKNPAVAGACNANDQTACFKDGGVLGKIPQSALYAPGLKALGLYPAPNVTGQVGYNYKSQTPSQQPLNQTLIRSDYQATANWRFTGRYMFNTNKSTLPYGIGGWSIRSNLDDISVISDVPGRNLMFSTTGIVNNTTSLEISFGQGHNSLDHFSTASKMTRAGSGLNLPLIYPNAVQMDFIPQMGFGGGRITNQPFYNTAQAPFTNFNTTYDVVGNLTKVVGAHNVKMGVYFQRSMKDQSAFSNFNGSYDFSNNVNNPYDTSHPFANAAVGVYNGFSQASAFLKPKWRYSNLEWYLQDNWKPGSNVTLDYGVRFYYITPQYDASKTAGNFLPDKFDASKAVRLYQPYVLNGARVGYDAATATSVDAAYIGRIVPGSGDRFQGNYQAGSGISDSLFSGSKLKVSPRVGLAWDIGGKQRMVARGGFGIFYDRPQGNTVFNLITNPPGMQTINLQWGYVKDIANTSSSSVLYAPVGLSPTQYDWKVPTVYGWNVGLQVRLPADFTLDIAHVGSESRNLLDQRSINSLPYGTAFQANMQDPTRGQTCTGCSNASAIPGGNALPTDLMRPYRGYGAITMWEFEAYSNYKALQTSINRRMSKGLMMGVSYVYSQARGIVNDDYGTARIDGQDRAANYGILAIDRPHNFVVSFVYQTPSVAKGALAALTNDWQLSGNYRWMSGNPYGVGFNIPGVNSTNITGSDQGARIVVAGDPGSGWSADPYAQINPNAFQQPSKNSIGMESARFFVYGPPQNNLDMSLSKSIRAGGKRRLEVRLDAFNVLNHTQFSAVNATVNFKGYVSGGVADGNTIMNLPYNSSGQLTNQNGIGTISGVRAARQLQLVTRFTF